MSQQKQFGDLILAFTDQFQLRYNDKGSGAHHDGAYWHPLPPQGFYPLGTIGVNNYGNVNGNHASICVQAAPGKGTAIAFPIDYQLIWADHGSGAHMDGSCWRPIPPAGYVALGDVFVTGYSKPNLHDIVCIKKELTSRGDIGGEIWNDSGSGAHGDIDTFQIETETNYLDAEKGTFAANTFVANNRYAKPVGFPEINVLCLPFPVEQVNDPKVPVLNSYNRPPAYSGKTIDRIVTVPFTAVEDQAYTLNWKVTNSPFYTVERQVAYKLELFDNNQTTVEQTISKTVSTGVTESSSSSFSKKVGIEVGVESGVSFLGAGGKVSAKITTELGWETSTGVEQFQSQSVEKKLVTPPKAAGALWVVSYVLYVVRADQSYLSANLPFDINSVVQDQYPKSLAAATDFIHTPNL